MAAACPPVAVVEVETVVVVEVGCFIMWLGMELGMELPFKMASRLHPLRILHLGTTPGTVVLCLMLITTGTMEAVLTIWV